MVMMTEFIVILSGNPSTRSGINYYMNIENTLNSLGLSPNEAKVYLAALEMGTASAQDIAHKAGVIRTTGYSVLERLAIRNFVL